MAWEGINKLKKIQGYLYLIIINVLDSFSIKIKQLRFIKPKNINYGCMSQECTHFILSKIRPWFVTPPKMNADDVSKLASFSYHSHPDIFQEVMADQPALVKFLSNPLVGAALGVVASKWLRKR